MWKVQKPGAGRMFPLVIFLVLLLIFFLIMLQCELVR